MDGPLQSALLSLYVLVAVLPALLVMEEYLETSRVALANHLVHHYALSAETGAMVRDVLRQSRTHELGSALFAIAGSLFFGLGFGRVLQLVHARAWQLPLKRTQTDTARYAAVLGGLYGLIVLLLLQLNDMGGPGWVRPALAPAWIACLVLFFVWAPRTLVHNAISRRDLLPGAVVTAVGLVVLMLISSRVMEFWVNLYARDYGGLGVVMALFFWIAIGSALIVVAASVSPPLAERRARRRAATVEANLG